MNPDKSNPVIIIGAGIAGLVAGQQLNHAGLPVLILDKGRGVGGRMATRRFGGGRFDHGAQFFSVRDDRFRQWATDWQAAGLITEWGQGFPSPSEELTAVNGYPRYRGIGGMTAVAKHLAHHLDVRLQTRVTAVANHHNQWIVHTESGEKYQGRALLLTPPLPQSLTILDSGKVALPKHMRHDLNSISYNPCLALMALFTGSSRLPEPGGLRFPEGPISWIADNHQKGISPDGHAVTIHASPVYSHQHWQTDPELVAQELLESAANWLHEDLLDWQLHRWRYSQPTTTYPEPMICLPGPPALALAGDAFGGPLVEGAATSGYEAAKALLSTLNL